MLRLTILRLGDIRQPTYGLEHELLFHRSVKRRASDEGVEEFKLVSNSDVLRHLSYDGTVVRAQIKTAILNAMRG